MGIMDRILLMLYTLAFAVLSLGAVVLCTQLIPFDIVWTNFLYLCGRWETGAVGAVFFIVSLRLLAVSLGSGKKARDKSMAEAVIVHGSIGDVQVTVSAVRELVEKTTRNVKGVRDVKVNVFAPSPNGAVDAPVQVKINIVVGQETRVTEITDQVQDMVKSTLTNIVGLDAITIDVVIDGISNASVQKQRVV